MFYPRLHNLWIKYWFKTQCNVYYKHQRTTKENWTVLENESNVIVKDDWYFKAYYIEDSMIDDKIKCNEILNDYLQWRYENTKQIKYFKKIINWIYYRLPISKKLWFNIEFKIK